MREWIARLANAPLALFFGLCGAVHAAPQVGWYWNPNESGRGFFVESRDGNTFIGAYLYDSDGHAMWVVAGGPNPDSYNYTGDLYYKTAGQTLFGNYVAPGPAVVVGQLSVYFNDDTHATVKWPGGTVQIEREIFGGEDPPFTPIRGWWWNADQSGTGYSVEVQGHNLFIVGFMYDDTARPVWYYSAGPMSSDKTYHGAVLQFANGQTMGGAYKAPSAPTPVGTLDVQFTAMDAATLTFSDATASKADGTMAKAGKSKILVIKPQLPRPPPYVFPLGFRGTYTTHVTQHVNQNGVNNDINLTLTIDGFTLIPEPATNTNVSIAYFPKPSTIANITFYEVQTAQGGTCIGQASGSTTLDAPGNLTILLVRASGEYTFHVAFTANIDYTATCTYSDGTVATVGPFIFPWTYDTDSYRGAIFDDTVVGNYIPTYPFTPGIQISSISQWTYHALRDIPP